MAHKIRVLLVDDNESTRDGTARLLEYEDNVEIIGFAEDGLEAIERVKELSPDVVLMDINMPRMNGIEATQHLQRESPRTQVIVVSVQDDAHYLKEAFRAGAVDFVAKPITSAELAQAIERAYSKIPPDAPEQPVVMPEQVSVGPGFYGQGPRAEGHTIGVLGLKGGVGKTTIAVNLAVGLADAGHRVVLVDASLLFGDVSVFLNTRAQYHLVDLAAMAEDGDLDLETMDSVLVPHESGLKLLISPPTPGESRPVDTAVMVGLLNFLKEHFEYVVVDTSTTFDGVLAAAIEASDRLIAVTTPTMPALKDTRILFGELAGAEYDLDHVLVVLNGVERNARITADQIGNFLKRPVAAQIPADPAATEAVNQGIALISLDPRRTASVRPLTSLVQLIKDSLAVVEEDLMDRQEQRGRGGLFGGLRGS